MQRWRARMVTIANPPIVATIPTAIAAMTIRPNPGTLRTSAYVMMKVVSGQGNEAGDKHERPAVALVRRLTVGLRRSPLRAPGSAWQ